MMFRNSVEIFDAISVVQVCENAIYTGIIEDNNFRLIYPKKVIIKNRVLFSICSDKLIYLDIDLQPHWYLVLN